MSSRSSTAALLASGGAAGVLFGYVLLRSDLCFHSAFRGLFERRFDLARAWILGVSIAAVGLAVVFAVGPWDGLTRGLGFRPVANLGGGLVFGVGMVVAASCSSGLFYKLGAGMLGALVGIAGWAVGDVAGRRVRVPGPTVLAGGEDGTIHGVLGLPRWPVALAIAGALVAWLWVHRTPAERAGTGRAEARAAVWGWPAAGAVLGTATIAAWVLAGVGGAGYGPSTVGAAAGLVDGRPNRWLVAFVLGIVPGSALAARATGRFRARGEAPARYAQLAVGGVLLGLGAAVAGGCNLGHGVSGLALLNVSSVVAVAGMVAGVGLGRAVQLRLRRGAAEWRTSARRPVSAG